MQRLVDNVAYTLEKGRVHELKIICILALLTMIKPFFYIYFFSKSISNIKIHFFLLWLSTLRTLFFVKTVHNAYSLL